MDKEFKSEELIKNKKILANNSKDIKELNKKFKYYSKNSSLNLNKQEFKLLISDLFISLGGLSDWIFDTIKKESLHKIEFDEFLHFLECLLSTDKTKKYQFSFELLTKNNKETFTKEDLKAFLYEINKIENEQWNTFNEQEFLISDKNIHPYELNQKNETINKKETYGNNKLVDELADYVFEEFKDGNNNLEDLEKITFERFTEVMDTNDMIYILFKSFSTGIGDLMVLKESEKHIKEFVDELAEIELKFIDYLHNIKINPNIDKTEENYISPLAKAFLQSGDNLNFERTPFRGILR